MKLQILAGTIGLVLLLGMSPLPQAEAKVFLIDDFSHDPDAAGFGQCDKMRTFLGSGGDSDQAVATFNATLKGVLGEVRTCNLTVDMENPNNFATIAVEALTNNPGSSPGPDMFRHQAGSNVQTITTLEYDAGGAGLGINLLSSDDVRFAYSTSDQVVDIIVRVTDSGGDWAEQTGATMAGTFNTLTEILFLITDFVDAPSMSMGVLNLDDIDSIKFTMDTTVGLTDYDLDNFDITMQMVGGEMFPVDTTALLLAGVELNAIWILPAIAAIGIGAFIVSRKRN